MFSILPAWTLLLDPTSPTSVVGRTIHQARARDEKRRLEQLKKQK